MKSSEDMCKDSGFISENNISSTTINEFNLYVQSHKHRTSFLSSCRARIAGYRHQRDKVVVLR
nr:MAG TPA: hypothetical protein [Caudoviricetes sp.]